MVAAEEAVCVSTCRSRGTFRRRERARRTIFRDFFFLCVSVGVVNWEVAVLRVELGGVVLGEVGC